MTWALGVVRFAMLLMLPTDSQGGALVSVDAPCRPRRREFVDQGRWIFVSFLGRFFGSARGGIRTAIQVYRPRRNSTHTHTHTQTEQDKKTHTRNTPSYFFCLYSSIPTQSLNTKSLHAECKSARLSLPLLQRASIYYYYLIHPRLFFSLLYADRKR